MREVLSVISSVSYVFFVISAITFGISLAVKSLLIKTVKKINRESDKNFDKIENIEEKSKCLEVLDKLSKRYYLHTEEISKIKKQERKNKVRKSLKLREYKVDVSEDKVKDIFISLFKDVADCFEGSGGYLNFSKNELLFMMRSLTERLGKIFQASDIIWLKTIKIPFYVEVVKLYSDIEKFKSKPSVIIITTFINFCLAVSRFVSPVGATKKLAGSFVNEGFSSIITNTAISLVGKEWAVLCYEKQVQRKNSLQKVA